MNDMRMVDNPRTELDLPPPFDAAWVAGDVLALGREAAAAGAEPGMLLIGENDALCDLALVLAPDRPRAECRAVLPLAMLAMADALVALGPPLKEVAFAWPDRLLVDGAEVGRARLALAAAESPDAVPDWGVVGLDLRLRLPPEAGEPGSMPAITALHEEGFGDVGVADIIESFARHFLHWMHRWTEEGIAPLVLHYRARLALPAGAQLDASTFDLVHPGPPERREMLPPCP